jgi:hypothetical protein
MELDRHVLEFPPDVPPTWRVYRTSENLAEERLAAWTASAGPARVRERRRRRSDQGDIFGVLDVGPDGRRLKR